MIKRIASFALALVLLIAVPALSFAAPESGAMYSEGASGEAVVRIQLRLRELGYLSYRPTGAYRSMTVEAVKAFQSRCVAYGEPLSVDGVMGPESMRRLFAANAPKVGIPDSVHMPRGPIASQLAATGQALAWQDIKPGLVVGYVYNVTDCNTGERFRLLFAGGENHAEMELFEESDRESFDAVCGSEYNFLKRPIVVEIEGASVAASMQCMPHGSDSFDNNGMDGHICVFFEGSLSHVGKLPDVEHEAAIRQASGR